MSSANANASVISQLREARDKLAERGVTPYDTFIDGVGRVCVLGALTVGNVRSFQDAHHVLIREAVARGFYGVIVFHEEVIMKEGGDEERVRLAQEFYDAAIERIKREDT